MRPAVVFENRFLRALPADVESGPRRREVRGACWSRVSPTPVRAPRVLAASRELAEQLGLDVDDPTFAEVMAGNRLLPGMEPWAACYGGHQFGNWAGQLGDGRVIGLGETGGLELQLKGAGPTPYSRGGDGRAVLRSSIREYVCSEAMHLLGVPTTRALSLVETGERVMRDMFYDGRPRLEPGAVVCRVAPTFVRFGNFELLAARGETDLLRHLVDTVIGLWFPDQRGDPVAWFEEVSRRTAALVAQWHRIGFVHGVMNTDNLSVLGITIDYGPYGFLDDYDPDFTPNTTDAGRGRYRFANQPGIAQWNLACLGEALAALTPDDTAPLSAVISRFADHFQAAWGSTRAAKFGFSTRSPARDLLADEAYAALRAQALDHTLFFRGLVDAAAGAPLDAAGIAYGVAGDWEPWLARWRAESPDRALLAATNPAVIPRNWMTQVIVEEAEAGDASGLERLLDQVRSQVPVGPQKRPEWAKDKAGCSRLSCSS